MESRTVVVDDVALHVGVTGSGPDVVVLSGGPGCVHYLERDELAPYGHRAWFPEPRGVGRSAGGPHDMERAVADLEAVRSTVGLDRWLVLGHSWGCDLAVRYAADHPESVTAVVGVAGRGPQRDRLWSEAYEAGIGSEPVVEIDWVPDVHDALSASFTAWTQSPRLWRRLADCPVPIQLISAEHDIRPAWPVAQLAALVPRGHHSIVPGVGHNFWATHPDVWTRTVTEACADVST